MALHSDAAHVFAALGDSTRLELITRLQDGNAHAIVELTDGTGLTRQAISKHLSVLEVAGLVVSEKVGRESRYLLHRPGFDQARDYLELASQQWDDALIRLKQFVEPGNH